MNLSGSSNKHPLNPKSLPNNSHSKGIGRDKNLQLEREHKTDSEYLREE